MKAVSTGKYIFALIGIGFLVGSFFAYRGAREFLGQAIGAEGGIVSFHKSTSNKSTSYYPVIEFATRSGETIVFTSPTSSSTQSFAIGQRVKILYRESEPEKARIDDFFSIWGVAALLGACGAPFLALGGGLILAPIIGALLLAQLKRNGTTVATEFQGVERNDSFSVLGNHPYRVITRWQDPASSKILTFRSGNIWFDPAPYLKDKPITVAYARGDPTKYRIDLSFLPKRAQ